MKKLKIGNNVYNLPAMWNEMTRLQLINLAGFTSHNLTQVNIEIKIALYCMKATVRSYIDKNRKERFMIRTHSLSFQVSDEEMLDIAKTQDYIFKLGTQTRELDIRLTWDPFKTRTNGKEDTLIGPDDCLTDMKYSRFVMIQSWQQKMDPKKPEDMDALLSLLWRKEGDTSEDMHPEWMEGIEKREKTVMMWFYIGSLNFMKEKFPRVFSGGDARGDVFDIQQRIIDELAGGDVTKKAAVNDALLYDVLYTIDCAIEKNSKQEKP